MVKIFFLICLLSKLYIPVFAQDFTIEYTKPDSIEEVGCWTVEVLPLYQIDDTIGDFFVINKCLKKHIVYPISALEDSIQGSVIVEFKVKKSGEIIEIKVAKGVRKDLDKEAVRIVKMVRCKMPARNRGKPVDYRETFVIPFRLSKNQH